MESTVTTAAAATTTAAEPCPFSVSALLIDPGVTGLSRLEKMMRKCNYRVTTSVSLQDGFDKLRERSNAFNVVVCDVAATMPGLNCFGFVQYVDSVLDLPVILMSDDRDHATVTKGIQNGACLFLHKPIKLKEVKIMWQEVFRKQLMKGGGNVNDTMVVVGGNGSGGGGSEDSSDDSRKRKEIENGETDDAPSSKKMRVVWTPELHRKFLEVVDKIGLEKAGPKKILKMMNIQYLTRENVASHLQKYRISLSRSAQQQGQNNTRAPPPPPVPNYEDLAARSHPNYKTLTSPAVMYAPPDVAPTATVPTAVPPAEIYGASLHRAIMQLPENHNRSLGLVAPINHDLYHYRRPSMLNSRPAPNLYDQGIIGPNFFQNNAAPPQPDNYHPFPATNGLCENSIASGIEYPSPTTSNSDNNGLLYDQTPPSSTNTTAPPAPAPAPAPALAPDFRRYMMERMWRNRINQNLEYNPFDLI